MATLEERKAKIEADTAAKLSALEVEAERRRQLAVLDEQIATVRAERKGMLDGLEVLLGKRAALVPARAKKEDAALVPARAKKEE